MLKLKTKISTAKVHKLIQVAGFRSSSATYIAIGDHLPKVEVQHGSPKDVINVADHFKKFNKAILIGVPGAFTPRMLNHIPSYLENFEKLQAAGIEEIACVSVNDAFVMSAWAKQLNTDGKITMLADPNASLVKALKLDFDLPVFGGIRSKRFAIVLKNGVVDKLEVEPDNTGTTCSLAGNILNKL